MSKFEWQATEGGPKGYPMEIISGSLHYHDGSGSLYVPDGATLHNGWGQGRSSHVVGEDLKPLPNRLSITFFSYTENQFYSGSFDLPYDKILALFQAGYYSPNEEGHTTYILIVVGVAPGGAVAVWLQGYDRTTEVFYGQAEKIDANWSRLTSATHISREEYVRIVTEDALKTPEHIEALHRNGIPIGLWASYRKRYDWQPLFTGMELLDKRIRSIDYFNGEEDYINYPLEKAVAESSRAVPRFIRLYWKNPTGKNRLFKLTFNEIEIMNAFKTLSPGDEKRPLKLEFLMENIDGKKMFMVLLRNDTDAIKLKRTDLETYGGY